MYIKDIADFAYQFIDFTYYQNIIMLSTNHYTKKNHFATFCIKNGTFIPVSSKENNFDEEVFNKEHSYQNQIHFLPDNRIIDIYLIGNYSESFVTKNLKPKLTEKTLLIVNTDLYHCGPNYYCISCESADMINKKTIQKIKYLEKNKLHRNELCGIEAIKTCIHICQEKKMDLL